MVDPEFQKLLDEYVELSRKSQALSQHKREVMESIKNGRGVYEWNTDNEQAWNEMFDLQEEIEWLDGQQRRKHEEILDYRKKAKL
jgi:PDZ domain-containing secreted protein